MSDFIRSKIVTLVKDPVVAEKLLPLDHPFGTKRPPIDTGYFETFNKKTVDLVDIRQNQIDCFDLHGVCLADGTHIKADIIIFATGFDAMSGALLKMGIVGRDSQTLAKAWQDGPKAYLGLSVHGFPNMFMITGPGSPSVLTNMPRSIEHHVDWITTMIKYVMENDILEVEAERHLAELMWASTNALRDRPEDGMSREVLATETMEDAASRMNANMLALSGFEKGKFASERQQLVALLLEST